MIRIYGAILFLFISFSFGLIGCEGCGSSPSASNVPTIPSTAKDTVIAVTKGLQEGNPDIVWAALPASYQKDINDIIHEFAAKMDPQIWDKFFVVGSKVVTVAKTKKAFILANPMLAQMGVNPMELNKNWDSIIAFVDVVINSELSKLDNVKILDGGKFLSGTGKAILKQSIALSTLDPENTVEMLKNISAVAISETADTAKVKITIPDETSEEHDFVKIEDRWVPKNIADNWAKTISETKEEISKLAGEELTQNKPKILAGIAMIESIADQLVTAQTQEDFDKIIAGIGGMF